METKTSLRVSERIIYEVTLSHLDTLSTLRQRESTSIFFSNLRKAVTAITTELALNHWPARVNYTAVYRGIRLRGFYSCDFDLKGIRMFRLKIVARVLNPALPRLGIDDNPVT